MSYIASVNLSKNHDLVKKEHSSVLHHLRDRQLALPHPILVIYTSFALQHVTECLHVSVRPHIQLATEV